MNVHNPEIFKVGDTVKVIKKVEEAEGWNDEWVKEMDRHIGCDGEVTEINPSGIAVKFSDTLFDWYFPSCALEWVG